MLVIEIAEHGEDLVVLVHPVLHVGFAVSLLKRAEQGFLEPEDGFPGINITDFDMMRVHPKGAEDGVE